LLAEQQGESKGKELLRSGFLCSPLRGSQTPSNIPLQASTRFARFGLPLTHCPTKGESPCEGLTVYRQVLYRIRQLAVFSARLRSNG
jgi:hypothetical protein